MPRRNLPLLALPLLAACAAVPEPVAPTAGPTPDFAAAHASAFQAEALDPAAAGPYLDLVDLALARSDAPGALPAGLAAVDALTTTTLSGFDSVGPHALVYRSRDGFGLVEKRLGHAWEASASAPHSPALQFLRGAVASALHELALFTGDT